MMMMMMTINRVDRGVNAINFAAVVLISEEYCCTYHSTHNKSFQKRCRKGILYTRTNIRFFTSSF